MKKAKPSVWKSILFMLQIAWSKQKKVLLNLFLLVIFGVISGIFNTLITPYVLSLLENAESLGGILASVFAPFILFLILRAAHTYTEVNRLIPVVSVRTHIFGLIHQKYTSTSYENLISTKFLESFNKAGEATNSNQQGSEAIWESIQTVLRSFLLIVFYMIVLTKLPIFLVLIIILTSIISFYCNKKIQDWSYKRREERRSINNKTNYVNRVATSLDFAKDIRLFGLKDWLIEIRDKSMQAYRDFLHAEQKRYFILDLLNVVFTILRNALAYWYLIRMVFQQNLDAASFVLYFTAFTNLSAQMAVLLENIYTTRKQADEISEIIEFLEWPEPFNFTKSVDEKLITPTEANTIRFENVSFRYPNANNFTVQNLNFTLEPGEKLAIVGLNGAGKTTLVRLLCGLLDPTEGTVYLNDQDIRTLDRSAYYKLFSVVFQKISILATTVEHNVLQGLEKDNALYKQALQKSGMSSVNARLELGDQSLLEKNVYPDAVELSGGELQTLMLSRALYHNRPFLILDEPTAALDPIAESEIYQKYSELSAHKSSLFISHRLASTRFCDRIFMMEDGKIIEIGNHSKLLELGGKYSELYDVQSQYYKDEVKVHV